jgi:hypothetical protein
MDRLKGLLTQKKKVVTFLIVLAAIAAFAFHELGRSVQCRVNYSFPGITGIKTSPQSKNSAPKKPVKSHRNYSTPEECWPYWGLPW